MHILNFNLRPSFGDIKQKVKNIFLYDIFVFQKTKKKYISKSVSYKIIKTECVLCKIRLFIVSLISILFSNE